jgi:hypothetical protein
MSASNGVRIDFFLAERADAAMSRFHWRNIGEAVLAPSSGCLYFFLAERTFTRF